MSLELTNIEKKIGLETHIHPTNLKLEKKHYKYFTWFNTGWQNNIDANYGWFG